MNAEQTTNSYYSELSNIELGQMKEDWMNFWNLGWRSEMECRRRLFEIEQEIEKRKLPRELRPIK